MKQLKDYWIIWATFCGLILSLWSYPASAQKLSFKEAFEKARTDWEVELPYEGGQFERCDDGFAFLSQDRRYLVRYDENGRKLWERKEPKGMMSIFHISKAGKRVYLVRLTGFEKAVGELLDHQGNTMWVSETLMFRISPTGKYLINTAESIGRQPVLTLIEGSSGTILWNREGDTGPWEAKFAGEERIAYYHDVTLHLLESLTGDVIWSRNLRPFLPKPFGGVEDRELFVSDNGSKIVVMMEGTKGKEIFILFDERGEASWAKEYEWVSAASEAVFSTSAKLLLVASRHRWILVDTETGKEIWNIPEKIGGHWTITDNLLRVEDRAIFIPTFFGTAVLELDNRFRIVKHSHFDAKLLAFPWRRDINARNIIRIESKGNRLNISKRRVKREVR